MAHKKAGGSTSLGRDSVSKRLGLKIFGGQKANAGNIIARQRGTVYRAGQNVKIGKDHTIFATTEGIVNFTSKQIRKFTGKLKKATFIHVTPEKDTKKK